jgi:small conductance mechanosensitive channel
MTECLSGEHHPYTVEGCVLAPRFEVFLVSGACLALPLEYNRSAAQFFGRFPLRRALLLLDQCELIQFGIRLGIAFLVFVIGRFLAGRARAALQISLAKTTLSPSMSRLLILAVFYGMLFLTLVVSLAIVGVPVVAVLSVSLIFVVILGIALQQSISNLAATIVFMLFQPFRVGETIEANGVMGVAKEIQLFSSVLVTADSREITLPNASIQGNNLVNYSRLGRLRGNFNFGVSYSDDLQKAKAIVREVLAADERVLSEPETLVFVKSLDDSSVTITAWPWAKPDDFWALQRDIPERVKLRFDAEGISIPFPQRDVHLYESRLGGIDGERQGDSTRTCSGA